MKAFSATVVGSTPEALADHVKAEIAKWTPVVKEAGVSIDEAEQLLPTCGAGPRPASQGAALRRKPDAQGRQACSLTGSQSGLGIATSEQAAC